jgi:hypothetical protein
MASNSQEQFLEKKFGKLTTTDLVSTNLVSTGFTSTNLVATGLSSSSISAFTVSPGFLSGSTPIQSAFTNLTAAANQTITATQLLSGTIIRGGNGGFVDNLPAAADVLARLNVLTNSQASVGMRFSCLYYNNGSVSATASTLATIGSGATLGGIASITTGSAKMLIGVIMNTAGNYFLQAL